MIYNSLNKTVRKNAMEYTLRTACPVRKSLELIGGKWKLLIIKSLEDGSKRYGALNRLIPDISEKMLIQELKKLTEFGILSKKYMMKYLRRLNID